MGYPDITAYDEAFLNEEGRFATLDIKPLRDSYGDLSYVAGNYAVVYNVMSRGKRYAVKCYTRNEPTRGANYRMISEYIGHNPSEYFIECHYLEDEVIVYDRHGDEYSSYPVLVMERVDGKSMGRYLGERCHNRDTTAVEELSCRFDRMAQWMLEQEFGHGDVKCDNLMVKPDRSLKLIDYDGMFVPGMEGAISPTLGTKSYQHWQRDKLLFDRHIDDYSLALVSVNLHALVDFPEYFAEYCNGESLIFDVEDFFGGSSPLADRLAGWWLARGDNLLGTMVGMLYSPVPRLENLRDTLAALNDREWKEMPDCDTGADDDMQMFKRGPLYGFENKTSGFSTGAIYNEAYPFNEGLAAVNVGGGWCYIDYRGNRAINCKRYSKVFPFREGLAMVVRGGKYGFIDKYGFERIKPRFDYALGFSEGFAVAEINRLKGFINKRGEWVIEPVYLSAQSFRSGFSVVGIGSGDSTTDRKYIYINRKGEAACDMRFDFAESFRVGGSFASAGGRLYKMIIASDCSVKYTVIVTECDT